MTIAFHVAVQRDRRTRRRRSRNLPRQASTIALERSYADRILRLTDLDDEFSELIGELPSLVASASLDHRYDAGEGERVRKIVDEIRRRVRSRMSTTELERVAGEMASQVSAFNREQLRRQVRAALGADVFASESRVRILAGEFVSENVALIRDIPERLATEVEAAVIRGLRGGASVAQLTDTIQERMGVARRRAKTIARDQIGTLNGQLNAARQRAMGVRRFVWRTARDERVRREHASREGQVYDYERPPNGELPGTPINCRCFAEPVISDLLGE